LLRSATLTEKEDETVQSENDADGPDADGGGLCPICSKPTREQVCEHHLGAFDLMDPGEGEYWVGLVGGALYEVREIGEVFNAARLDYAKARIGGKSHTEGVPAWCNEDAGLKEYVGSFEEANLLLDLDPPDYFGVQEYADELAGEGLANVIRAALFTWLGGLGIRVLESSESNENSMVSSVYEVWWCQSPEDAAAKLTSRLRQILDRRAKGPV
jgi:hypothetical protein